MAGKKQKEAVGSGVTSRGGPVPSETLPSGGFQEPTAKPVTSLDVFHMCIDRAKNQIKIHKAAHGRQAKPEKWLSDAHRAAVVLAVSALDAFVRTFVISRIRSLLISKSGVLPPALVAEIKRFLKDDGLLEAARKADLLERVEKAFRNDFERKSFQGTKNIEECMKMIGFDDIFRDVAIRAQMNESTLREMLDQYTDRRHAIAHRGDYDLNQRPPKESDITKKYAKECIDLVSIVANQIHKLESEL